MSQARSFDYQRARGIRIEKRIGQWLMENGWMVLPGYEFSGQKNNHAPLLQAFSASESAIIPDLLAARNGAMRWVEVKLKTSATWTRTLHRWDTGIDLHHWQSYCRVQKATGADVYVSFSHEYENTVTLNRISDLESTARIADEEHRMSDHGMVFWPIDDLNHVAKFDDVAPGDRTDHPLCRANACRDRARPACDRSDPAWPLCDSCQGEKEVVSRRWGKR